MHQHTRHRKRRPYGLKPGMSWCKGCDMAMVEDVSKAFARRVSIHECDTFEDECDRADEQTQRWLVAWLAKGSAR